jgi:prevent-host-death family protein
MRSVKISDLMGSLSDYAREGLREPIVVTRKGKPVMAVMPLTKYADWESVSLALNPRFMEIIERSRASARVHGCISLEEVRRRHGLAPRRAWPRKSR